VNYLAHFYFSNSSDTPEYKLGAILPDLARAAHPERRLVVMGEMINTELGAGVLTHWAIDKHFHSDTTMHHLLVTHKQAEQSLRVQPERAYFFRHLATEILIDHCLLQVFPNLDEQFYNTMSKVSDDAIQHFYGLQNLSPLASKLQNLLNLFCTDQFMRDYHTLQGVGRSVERVYKRVVKKSTGLSAAQMTRLLEAQLENTKALMPDIHHYYQKLFL
jgi:hypothetical protein